MITIPFHQRHDLFLLPQHQQQPPSHSSTPPRSHPVHHRHCNTPDRNNSSRSHPLKPSTSLDHSLHAPITHHAAATFCMNGAPNPDIRVQNSTPDVAWRQDSVGTAAFSDQDWVMYQASMGPVAATNPHGLKRARSHDRTLSTSTINSTGPASPYAYNFSYPQIANSEFAPEQADQATIFSKNLHGGFLPQGYIPSQLSHTPVAHQAMKAFAIDHHQYPDDFDFAALSRQSMSSHGHDSPATPQSGVAENMDSKQYNVPQSNDARPGGHIQLFRTESQAFQDELYNPPTSVTSTPAPAKAATSFLSPHRNLISERLQTANLARSQSPNSAMSRERSPFREGSRYAAAGDWRSPVQTAAGIRQQQKAQADQAELAQHMPQLHREPTKTISPKDALLDYNEQEPPLFQDTVPEGYKQHTGGNDTWSGNGFVSQPGSAFGNLQAPDAAANFRATSAEGYGVPDAFAFHNLPLPLNNGQMNNTAYQASNNYAAPKTANYLTAPDPNPQFPATLTSMDSSASDPAPPSSAEVDYTSAPQRPADTRAHTGTYTCTYHNCTQRFESQANLQRHKRDFHRAQNQQHIQQQQQQQQQQYVSEEPSGASSSGTTSESPRSTESPGPSGAGMTSAAILARNSQAGPHKCSRINPSTGKPCNTIFSRPYDLTRHEDTIHNGRKQKVRCTMCREEKTFSRNDALTRHMRVVHPEVEAFGKRGRRD